MSLITDNVIPGEHGKVFGTNAKEDIHLQKIAQSLKRLEDVEDVVINYNVFPREFTVYTNKIVTVKAIEDKVILVGFHALPKENTMLH